jgi:hypothetical protein
VICPRTSGSGGRARLAPSAITGSKRTLQKAASAFPRRTLLRNTIRHFRSERDFPAGGESGCAPTINSAATGSLSELRPCSITMASLASAVLRPLPMLSAGENWRELVLSAPAGSGFRFELRIDRQCGVRAARGLHQPAGGFSSVDSSSHGRSAKHDGGCSPRFRCRQNLVNNAGVALAGDLVEASWEQLDWIRGLNIDGVPNGIKIPGEPVPREELARQYEPRRSNDYGVRAGQFGARVVEERHYSGGGCRTANLHGRGPADPRSSRWARPRPCRHGCGRSRLRRSDAAAAAAAQGSA